MQAKHFLIQEYLLHTLHYIIHVLEETMPNAHVCNVMYMLHVGKIVVPQPLYVFHELFYIYSQQPVGVQLLNVSSLI